MTDKRKAGSVLSLPPRLFITVILANSKIVVNLTHLEL